MWERPEPCFPPIFTVLFLTTGELNTGLVLLKLGIGLELVEDGLELVDVGLELVDVGFVVVAFDVYELTSVNSGDNEEGTDVIFLEVLGPV